MTDVLLNLVSGVVGTLIGSTFQFWTPNDRTRVNVYVKKTYTCVCCALKWYPKCVWAYLKATVVELVTSSHKIAMKKCNNDWFSPGDTWKMWHYSYLSEHREIRETYRILMLPVDGNNCS